MKAQTGGFRQEVGPFSFEGKILSEKSNVTRNRDFFSFQNNPRNLDTTIKVLGSTCILWQVKPSYGRI